MNELLLNSSQLVLNGCFHFKFDHLILVIFTAAADDVAFGHVVTFVAVVVVVVNNRSVEILGQDIALAGHAQCQNNDDQRDDQGNNYEAVVCDELQSPDELKEDGEEKDKNSSPKTHADRKGGCEDWLQL